MALDHDQLAQDLSAVKEDVAYIRAKVEAIPDHEERLRSLERWKWGLPVTAILAFFGLYSQ